MSLPSPSRHPLPMLIFGAICISFAPVFVKLIDITTLGPTAIGFWRTLFGGITLVLIALLRGDQLRLDRRALGFAVLAGFIFFLDIFVWHRSIIYCGAGMSTILGNTQVFATAFLSALIFKERLSGRFFFAASLAIVGVVLLVGLLSQEVAFTPDYIKGILFGLATGIAYANYLITLKCSRQGTALPGIVPFMAWISLLSALFLGVTASFESAPLLPGSWSDVGILVSLGIVAQAIGWWVITDALAKIDASRAGLVLLLQPTLAMIWGVLFFAEQFTSVQLLGAVVTLGAIYYGGWRSR